MNLILKKEFHLEPAQNFVPNEWINHNQCLETFPSKDNVDGMFAVMGIPTMISTLILAPKVMQAAKEYFAKLGVPE